MKVMNEIEPYLSNIIIDLENSDTWIHQNSVNNCN